MRYSMWTYPWDVQDLGFETAVGDLRAVGLTGVSLATSYHAGRFLRPRGSAGKVYWPEDGTIYFKPDPARWEASRLKPQMSSVVERGDILGRFVDERERTGLKVHAWTVCLHNMRLGVHHPETCTVNAFGDINYFSLCPSNADARAYSRTLVADLTARYRPDSVEIECPSFLGYRHGYHHELDGVGLTDEDDFLMSLCFCPSCLARAAAAGIDGAAARRAVIALMTETLERPVPEPRWPDFARQGPAALSSHPEIAAYAAWRTEPVTSLVAEIRAEADPGSQVYYLLDHSAGWRSGCDPRACVEATDGLVHCTYDMSPEAVTATIANARTYVGPDKYLGAGLRVLYPEMKQASDLATRARAAVAAGAEGVNFYCYGLIPKARLAWVGEATN